MKTSTKLKNSHWSIALAVVILFSACTKNDETIDKPAPQLPPETSFIIDFDNFKDADTTAYKNSLSYQNWGWAATNVAVWNAALTLTLVVPVAAFYESFHHTGVYDPDADNWIWSYNFYAGGALHLAQLKASLIESGVKWEMYITRNNAYSDFLWYTGVSALDNSNGYWLLNNTPQDPTSFIAIDWSKDVVNESAQIKYTNIIPDHQDNGAFILYGVENNNELDAFYDIYSVVNDNLMHIRWSRELAFGKVMDKFHFGDPDWHCWDEILQDVVCE
ncbi:MAG: hypothetical protein R2750_12545 [Bacteroidales bacterium]